MSIEGYVIAQQTYQYVRSLATYMREGVLGKPDTSALVRKEQLNINEVDYARYGKG